MVTTRTVSITTHCLGKCLDNKDFFEAHSGAWAFGSAIASIASLLVTGIGIYFVWRQLVASREALTNSTISAKAAADAAKTAYDSIRPWLKFEVRRAFIYLNPNQLDLVGCQIDYRLENIGKIPAIQVEVLYKPVASAGIHRPVLADELASLEPIDPRMPTVLFPGDTREIGPSRNFPFPPLPDESMMGFHVVAMARYRASPDGPYYNTPLVLGLQHSKPPADRIYRFWRGMGAVECMALTIEAQTPSPT